MRPKDEPAFPVVFVLPPGHHGEVSHGLTKFEHTVIEMAKGVLTGQELFSEDGPDFELCNSDGSRTRQGIRLAEHATGYATAVWDALEKDSEP